MKRTRGRIVHVEALDDLDRRLALGATSLSGWRVCGLDLTAHGARLEQVRVAGATFVDCRFAPGDAARLEVRGAEVLPGCLDEPVPLERTRLYSPLELFDARPYAESLDARAYAWSQRPSDPARARAMALHDHAIDLALQAWIRGRTLVGVMGGHRAERGEPTYRAAAALGHALGATRTVATGGGPGAMEAANLGAWLAGHTRAELDEAVAMLAEVPSYRPSVDAWAARAFEVRERFGDGRESLGIPTWHYGHEPANAFATGVAKYFRNATREAILLEVCDAGIVFLPGAGGTVQEVFQDACENYYADESSVAPMVLVGRRYWTEVLPAWPLLRALARGRPMEPHVHLVDTVEEAAAVVAQPA